MSSSILQDFCSFLYISITIKGIPVPLIQTQIDNTSWKANHRNVVFGVGNNGL